MHVLMGRGGKEGLRESGKRPKRGTSKGQKFTAMYIELLFQVKGLSKH
jgi:hypothetical protein